MHEYVGVIHIHSKFSDGTGSMEDIVGPANELGVDFLVINDHMTLGARDAGWEGYHNNVLVLVGYEHNDVYNKNHYLIIGTDNKVLSAGYTPAQYVKEAKETGCAGFIAHPAEKRKAFSSLPAYPWEAWDVDGFGGIEIWNQLSDWVEQITPFNLLFRIMFPRRFLHPPSEDILQKWDALSQKRRMSIIGGVDAHAHTYGIGFFHYTIISYKVSFKSIRTHILLTEPFTGDFAADQRRVINALRMGNGFVSNYRVKDARGFRFWIDSGGNCFVPGTEISWHKGMYLHASLPFAGNMILIGDGRPVYTVSGKSLKYELPQPGVYRLEVSIGKKPWIYTNPIYVRNEN